MLAVAEETSLPEYGIGRLLTSEKCRSLRPGWRVVSESDKGFQYYSCLVLHQMFCLRCNPYLLLETSYSKDFGLKCVFSEIGRRGAQV